MAAQALTLSSSSTTLKFSFPHSKLKQRRFSSFSLRNPRFQPIICTASNVQPKKHSSSSSNRNTNKNKNLNNNNNSKKKNNNKTNAEFCDSISTSNSSLPHIPTPLPKPPAGFVVDDTGKLLSSSKDRLATLVDPANNLPLECVIRRLFTSSRGDECMLLCPLDMPVQILQSTGVGWSEVSYEELESMLPAASFALAKLRMHLVYSGYCYTARGGFCYSEEDIFEFHADGNDGDMATEGVEITHFNLEGAHYMIYTPSDPLLFVAAKDRSGMLQIADDELLEDPAVISAIDEETEFNALVEEEAALFDSLLGIR
ncbi:uncharacterized protein [Cicer arietinum]|uniref:Uncharacterized protein LOC101499903 n=1 Tax=Cicer arietinum TaxID=3827 RepID=A0A1S2YEA5_CICAR|nr:uncharacterized protein LOC101499903 [Cicer arietinum]